MKMLSQVLRETADKDLAVAKWRKVMVITNTKHDTIEIEYKGNGHYIIRPFNNTEHVYYSGRKHGAVIFLMRAYEVVHG